MERKFMIAGIGIAVLLIAGVVAGIMLFKTAGEKPSNGLTSRVKEAEASLASHGIKNAAGTSLRYESLQAEYFYALDECRTAFDSAVQKFGSSITIKSVEKTGKIKGRALEVTRADGMPEVKELPIAAFSGRGVAADGEVIPASTNLASIISGESACSEKILVELLCSMLDAPDACSSSKNEEPVNWQKSRMDAKDAACYDSCLIKYSSGGIIFSRMMKEEPCGRIAGYAGGESRPSQRECQLDSCKSDASDIGCCAATQCVYNGKCYNAGTSEDIGNDGQTEICSVNSESNSGVWVDADSAASSCTSGFIWLGCSSEEECRYGSSNIKGNINGKKEGLCCGDDRGENPTGCKGKICPNKKDYACCPAESCAFNGKCYKSGCNQIELGKGQKLSAFCNGDSGQWTDLDDGNCAECLGKNAWSGTLCCGDDLNEGKYNTRFVFNSKNGTSRMLYYQCTGRKTDCVYPSSNDAFSEGFYAFKDDAKYMQGSYYCKSGQWYSVDLDAKYCRQSGFSWDKNKGACCGDNENEFFLKGTDGTSACCALPSDRVEKSKCIPTTLCGNNVLDEGELCELPNTKNNDYCSQSQQQCLGLKLGLRSPKGYCDGNCICKGDDFEYSCVKGSCGASCESDSDCGKGEKCDTASCSCKPKAYCGDNIIQGYNDFGQKEECELPGTSNSEACQISPCKDKKSILTLGLKYGSCGSDCKCDYSMASYGCRKGICGAECDEDGTGCGSGLLCSTETCACYPSSVCGDGKCEQGEDILCPTDCQKIACPSRIEITFDKSDYYLGDVVTGEVRMLDGSSTIPNAKFDIDFSVNGAFVRTSTYTTGSTGSYSIKKSVTNFIPKGTHKYIAKSKVKDCGTVSDTKEISVHVENQYSFPYVNSSRFELIIGSAAVEEAKPECGNGIVEKGEACDGASACRPSIGCDYKNKIFDYAETCSSCGCPEDRKSAPNDEAYCSSCQSCGDGEINCGEDCEEGKLSNGLWCRSGKLYERFDSCSGCKWADDGLASDILIDACECKCPSNPKENCAGGNYINYTQDYSAGCANGKCNACSCIDTYTKDKDNDGIDDKCEPELCGNRIDDNDNGAIDEDGCIWYYCSQCGYGLYSLCTRQECAKFEQGCFFSRYASNIFGIFNYTIGSCSKCSGIKKCEEYANDNLTCSSNPCSIGSCIFDDKNAKCCTDSDNDNVCDSRDNCPGISNPGQENSDKDAKGDACERCISEPNLLEPKEQAESNCGDGIDEDCDGLKDCKDPDCAGKGSCCQTKEDCIQGNCAIESCISNICEYKSGYLCYNSECPKGSYCDIDGKCKAPDASEIVCNYCAPGYAYGSGYGVGYISPHQAFSQSKGLCCGNDANEYYIVEKASQKAACCSSASACIDSMGKCHESNSTINSATGKELLCIDNFWLECSSVSNVLCAEAGSSYASSIPYRTSGETGWYCTYDGSGPQGYGWRLAYPKEDCSDNLDNDCDSKIDFNDEDCLIKQ